MPSSRSFVALDGISLCQYDGAGFDFIYRAIRSALTHQNLAFWRQMFGETRSETAEAWLAGRRIVFTIDPENIKAILATQFGDYGKGEPFHQEWKAFLGDSIFTTDGTLWHNSRQLLRPQFIKDRVSDLHVFETHIQTLFRASKQRLGFCLVAGMSTGANICL